MASITNIHLPSPCQALLQRNSARFSIDRSSKVANDGLDTTTVPLSVGSKLELLSELSLR